jgi:hypothetical protein
MSRQGNPSQYRPAELLDLFCSKLDDQWVVSIAPQWTPSLLAPFFDQHGETIAAWLDFEDLDRYMRAQGASYDKRVSKRGSVQLIARGPSCDSLAQWLLTAICSGVRRPSGNQQSAI